MTARMDLRAPHSQEGSPGGCCTRKGPGVRDGDTLDLGWSGRRLETRGRCAGCTLGMGWGRRMRTHPCTTIPPGEDGAP